LLSLISDCPDFELKEWAAKEGYEVLAYRLHAYEEVKALVSKEVASRLDPNESYGIW
jgi:hypothetical protein